MFSFFIVYRKKNGKNWRTQSQNIKFSSRKLVFQYDLHLNHKLVLFFKTWTNLNKYKVCDHFVILPVDIRKN